MPFRWNPREHFALVRYVLKWLLIAVPVGAMIGSAVAFFLWSLDEVTRLRWATDTPKGLPWLLFLLPVAGIGIGAMYHLLGKSVEGGNNLIMDQIHEPGGGVPSRMAPLVLIGTIITHLFGGSAGREGTAVQMGGSIASTVGRSFGLNKVDTRTLLMVGVAAGFGAVFGTPLTGAIFAIEVLVIGLVDFRSTVPCLIGSVVGNLATTAWGIKHTQYAISAFGDMSWVLLVKVAVASIAFGLASVVFAELTHGLNRVFKRAVPWPMFRPALGGLLVIGLAYAIGPDYLGIGVNADPRYPNQVSIVNCFHHGGATCWSWWWKILFTAVTLSSGFKGGEVTPLFFVGAALGNAMGRLLHAPVDLFAGLGFVGVFAGATNTPLACTIMGIELFAAARPELIHSGLIVYLATSCFLAYLLSGHCGIYLSQRIGIPKLLSPNLPPRASLRAAREMQPLIGGSAFARFAGGVNSNRIPEGTRELWAASIEATANTIGGNVPQTYSVAAREIGQLSIYMTPREKRKASGMRAFFAKPLYQEVIDAAKAAGIRHAVAHHTHYGYTSNGRIQANNHELPNKDLNLCVELIAEREELDLFCRRHGTLIEGKSIVYKHMERWDIASHEEASILDAPREENNIPEGAAVGIMQAP